MWKIDTASESAILNGQRIPLTMPGPARCGRLAELVLFRKTGDSISSTEADPSLSDPMVIVGISFLFLLRGLPTPSVVPFLLDPSLRIGALIVPFIRFRVSVLPGLRGVRVGVARCMWWIIC